MIPSTIGGLLTILVLVTPGIWYELARQRCRPGRSDSAFVETSRILLAGVLISVAVISMLAFAASLNPGFFVNIRIALTDASYVPNHLLLTMWTLLWFLTLALTLGPTWLYLGPGRNTEILAFSESLWMSYFIRVPAHSLSGAVKYKLKFVELFVRTSTGALYQGRFGGCSAEPEASGRELALVRPLWYAPDERSAWTKLDDLDWNALILKGDDISEIRTRNIGEISPSAKIESLKEAAAPVVARWNDLQGLRLARRITVLSRGFYTVATWLRTPARNFFGPKYLRLRISILLASEVAILLVVVLIRR